MSRAFPVVVALAATLAVLFAGLTASAADAAAHKPAASKRAKVVCFKKSGRKVCRKRRAPAKNPVKTPLSRGLTPVPPPGSDPSQRVGSDPSQLAPLVGSDPSQPAPAVGSDPSQPGSDPGAGCGASPWVGYAAEDVGGVFKLTGKRTCVPGPNVLFQLRNADAQEHNLYAEGVAPKQPARAIIASLDPEKTAEASATLSAGEWRLFCSIEGHETMSRTLTVTG